MAAVSHRRRARMKRSWSVVVAAAAMSVGQLASADSGTWTNTAGGNWGDIANWGGGAGPIADGAGFEANFATLNITADTNVVLTEPRTIGSLTFADTTTGTAGSWILGDGGVPANVLTLGVAAGAPTITVNNLGAGKSATLNVGLAGTQGLTKAGVGWLVLGGANTYSGATAIDRGLLTFADAASIANVGAASVTVNAAGAVGYGAATVLDAGFLSKINTASTGAFAITATDAATNFDFTSGPLAAFANMGIGAAPGAAVLYTGTITPAASTYRLGGGGGTLQVQNALTGANNLVVGNGAGASGTVALAADNTYTGTTTIANGMTLSVGTGATAVGSISGAAVVSDGTLAFNRTGEFTVANTITGGTLVKRGNGGTMTFTGTFDGLALNVDRAAVAPTDANPNIFVLDGGSITASALSTVQGRGNNQSPGRFIMNSGTATFNGGLRVDQSDIGGTIRVNGGALTTTDLTIMRNAPNATTFSSGLIVTGGTVNAESISIATHNSWASMSVEGGSVTASGTLLIGNQQTSGRGGQLRVTDGSLSAGTLVLSRVASNGNANNVVPVTFSGGTSSFDSIHLGYDAAVTAGSTTVNINGGTVYLGSAAGGAGIVKNGTQSSTINLTSGTLGAKGNWSASHNMNLNGTGAPFTIKAADAADAPFDIELNGNLSGAGSLTKTGGGSLTLNGASTYAGTTTVLAGRLIGNTGSIPGSVVNDGNVTFNQPVNDTYAGVVSGTGSFTKSGAGRLTLSSAQTYTGATLVDGGTLRIGGAQATSGVTVANGAALAMANGGASVNALVLGAGAGDATTLFVNGGAGIAPLHVTATDGLVANGTTTVDLGIAGYTVGQHVLVDYAGAIGGNGFAGFTLGTLPPRVTGNLVNNAANTSLDLNVTAVDFPQWIGNVNGDWDIDATANWQEATSGATTTYLESSVPGDQVLFTDAATGTTTVNLTTTVQPSFITVNNSAKSYTFTGGGRISGPTGMNKQGDGTLTISNTGGNNYTGATNILGGTIALGANEVLSDTGALNINGGTLDVGGFFDTTGVITLINGNINAAGGMLAATSYDLRSGTVAAMLAGAGTLEKNTEGTVTLSGQSFYTGNTNVNEGTLQLGGSDVLPVTTTLTVGSGAASGAVDLNSFNQQVERLASSGTGTANSVGNSVAGGGPATLTITGSTPELANSSYAGALDGNLALVWNSAGVLTLSGSSTFTGGTRVNNGGTLAINGDAALGAVPDAASNNLIFENVAGTLRAAAADVTLAATRDILIDGVTLNFDSNGGSNTMTVNGVVTGGGFVGKVGNGTVIFNGANTYGGNTTIVAGNLRAGHNSAFSAGTVRITGSSASMQLADGVTITNNLISQSNSENMVDVPTAGATATFAGNVTVETGGGGNQYRVAANGAGATLFLTGSATLPNTFIVNAGNVVMTGGASIVATGTSADALLGRPNTSSTVMSLTLKDNAFASFDRNTNLGNGRNMTDLSLTIQDAASYTTGGTFTILQSTAATATSNVNLNGGTLTSGPFLKPSTGAGQTAAINFNGGTLKPNVSSAAFIPAAAGLAGKVKDGGAIIDTNGFDVTIAAPLEADGAGGLTKNGVGTLTTSGANTYTGATVVNAGKLEIGASLTTSSALTVADGAAVEITPGLTHVVKTGSLTLGASSKVDIKDNKLITSTPAGAATGGVYAAGSVHRMVQTAYQESAWTGPGLMTSMPDAASGLTTVAIATGEQLGRSDFAGQPVGPTDTVAFYTYGGDTNFDGKLDADDYGTIDFNVLLPGPIDGYYNGDFNYDGVVNADDYGVIDFNILAQTTPFPTGGDAALASSSAGLAGVTAVPEPSGVAFVLGAAALLGRRRRRGAR